MTENHLFPITPLQWQMDAWQARIETMGADVPAILLEAARWGADQELEACLCEVSFLNSKALADRVRAARRPKPPSLKDQALKRLAEAELTLIVDPDGTIRRALEQLDD